jgi:hypothetical protein
MGSGDSSKRRLQGLLEPGTEKAHRSAPGHAPRPNTLASLDFDEALLTTGSFSLGKRVLACSEQYRSLSILLGAQLYR